MPVPTQVTRCFRFFFLAFGAYKRLSFLICPITTLQMVAGFDWSAWPSCWPCFSSLFCPMKTRDLCSAGLEQVLDVLRHWNSEVRRVTQRQRQNSCSQACRCYAQHNPDRSIKLRQCVCKRKSDLVAAQSEGRGSISFTVSASRYQYNVCLGISPGWA